MAGRWRVVRWVAVVQWVARRDGAGAWGVNVHVYMCALSPQLPRCCH
eukprot:COSAG01_NODE_3528_length_5967_cov_14.678255_12_plen_47_part_00